MLVSVTVAPLIGSPCASLTVPAIDPVGTCATPIAANEATITSAVKRRRDQLGPPLPCLSSLPGVSGREPTHTIRKFSEFIVPPGTSPILVFVTTETAERNPRGSSARNILPKHEYLLVNLSGFDSQAHL